MLTVFENCSHWLCATGILLAGCGGPELGNLPATVDATGIVTLDGKPVEGASVVFAPVEPGAYPAFAITDNEGEFSLKAFEAKSGAVPGSYRIQVSKTVEVEKDTLAIAGALGPDAAHAAQDTKSRAYWKNSLPEKYASPVTSQITFEIPNSGRRDIKVELVSK